MRRSRKLTLTAMLAAAAISLTACSSFISPAVTDVVADPDFAPGTTMARLHDAGTITIGTKFDQPLFGVKGPDGPEGFDVEIGKIVAAKLGIPADKIKWQEAVSANREPFIANGTVDIIVATYTINDARKKVIDFAGPYFIAGQSLLVLGNNTDITSEADIVDKPVCSVTGSSPALKLAEIGARPSLTDTYSACLEPLRTGKVVAMSTDNVILAGLAAQNPGEFKIAGKPFTQEPYGIGLKHGDDDFRAFINDVLEESYADGSYEAAWKKTVGDILPFVPGPAVDRY